MGLDQRVQRDIPATQSVDGLSRALHIGQALGLGQHQVGRPFGVALGRIRTLAGGQHHPRHVFKTRVPHGQQAHADPAKAVVRPGQQ